MLKKTDKIEKLQAERNRLKRDRAVLLKALKECRTRLKELAWLGKCDVVLALWRADQAIAKVEAKEA